MEKVYLYIARRNKQDTKIVGVLKSSGYIHAVRVDDLSLLGLPAPKIQALKSILEMHKFEWDLWLESADSYKTLKQNMLSRGILAASSPNAPLIEMESDEIPKPTLIRLNKNKIMTRRMN